MLLYYNLVMKNLYTDTIVAISTPLASGAISIVRLTGDNALTIADKLFTSKNNKKPSSLTPRMMTLGTFNAKGFNEQLLCVVFKAPNSFTGENMVEFQCHGGVLITKGILSACIESGARLATAGEFTKRAFLNGKMALADAEGMMDMINAQSEAEIRAGYNLLSGELSKTAFEAQTELTDILAEIEVSFDYPEETIEFITKSNAKERLLNIQTKINNVLANASTGKIIKDGVNVAILGKPNVGKSSLLNKLIKDEKAIVTPIAGTTRDVIEGTMSINGLRFNLYDTAGIRETDDQVEQIGVNKAKNIINSADIILFLKESDKEDEQDKEVANLLKDKKHLIIINKSDKTGNYQQEKNIIRISALENKNIDKVTEALYELASEGKTLSGGLIITNERHQDALLRANSHLQEAINAIDEYSLDLVTIDINLAYSALGEITGNTTNEEILNAIFSKFCLGK